MKNTCTIFALGNVLRGHLKKTEDDEDSRASQDLSVVMLLVGNFLLNFKVMATLATVLLVLKAVVGFFSGTGIL